MCSNLMFSTSLSVANLSRASMGCLHSTPAIILCPANPRDASLVRINGRGRRRNRDSIERLWSEISPIPRVSCTPSSIPLTSRRTRRRTTTVLLRHLPLLRARTSTPLPKRKGFSWRLTKINRGVEPAYGLFKYHLDKPVDKPHRIFPGYQSSWEQRSRREKDFSEDSDRLDSIQVLNGQIREWKFRTDRRKALEPRLRLVMTSVSSSQDVLDEVRSPPDGDSRPKVCDNVCI